MAIKCPGCGAAFQSSDPEVGGYLPANILHAENQGDLICQRCYRIRHYAKLQEVDLQAEDYWRTVQEGIRQGELIVKVVDIIDFAGSWNDRLVELLGDKPWILAVNKVDLLPKQTKTEQIYQWLHGVLAQKKTRGPRSIRLLSAEERFGVGKLREDLKQGVGKKRIATIVGTTNVGKSSLLNQLVGKKDLTISKFPGTTLGITANFLPEEKIKLLDTPGIIPAGRISDRLCPQCNLSLIPAQEISRKTYKLETGQALLLGGLASFEIVEEENRPIILAFAAQGVKFHRTKGERIEEIRQKHSGDWLIPPCSQCQKEILEGPWEKIKVTLEEEEDLAISGLGWISVRRGPAILEMQLPKGISWQKRKALISPKEKR